MASTLSLGTSLSEKVQVDCVSFAVPAQRFKMDANVTTAGHINVVLEFALRLLHTVGRMSVGDVQAYFGFNARETTQLVSEMIKHDWAEEIDGELALGKVAKDAFLQTGHEPRIVQVERIDPTVGFDKVSFCLADWVGSREPHIKTLPVLQIEDRERASKAFQVVKEEFQRHFKEYAASRSRGTDDWSERTRIYSVEDAEPKGHFRYELQIPLVLRLDSDPKVEPDLSALEAKGRPGSRRQLIAAVSKFVSAIVAPSDGAAALNLVSEFDQGLLTRLRAGSLVAPDTWAKYVGPGRKVAEKHQPVVLLCGSSVVQGTRDVLLEWTAQHEPRNPPITGMLWLRPCVTHWGRSGDFWELAEELSARTPEGTGLTLVTVLRSSGLNPAELRKAFMPSADERAPFTRGYGTRNDDLPGALEVLLNPGRWVAVLVHVPMGQDGPSVPIGFCSAAPEVVRGAQAALAGRLLPHRSDDRVLWKPNTESDERVKEIVHEALTVHR